MGHRYIATEHLFLSILGVEDSFAARLLRNGGADAPSMRVELAEPSAQSRIPRPPGSYGGMRHREVSENTVEIHGTQWNADYIRDLLSVIRASNWHWQGSKWKARDIAISRTDGTCSFNLDLANASGDFALVENGWKKDHCLVCRWDLFEAEDEHGVGYTNGQNWLCVECYQRFWQHPDFFSSSQSEMT